MRSSSGPASGPPGPGASPAVQDGGRRATGQHGPRPGRLTPGPSPEAEPPALDRPVGPRPPVLRDLMVELDAARAEVERVRAETGQRLADAEVRATTAEIRIADVLYDAAKQRSELMGKLQQALQALADSDLAREQQLQRAEDGELRRVKAERQAAELSTKLSATERRRADLADQLHRLQQEITELRRADLDRQDEWQQRLAAAEERVAAAEARAREAEQRLRAAADTLSGVRVRVHARARLGETPSG